MNIKLLLSESDVRSAIMDWLRKTRPDLVKDQDILLEFHNGDVTKTEVTLRPAAPLLDHLR